MDAAIAVVERAQQREVEEQNGGDRRRGQRRCRSQGARRGGDRRQPALLRREYAGEERQHRARPERQQRQEPPRRRQIRGDGNPKRQPATRVRRRDARRGDHGFREVGLDAPGRASGGQERVDDAQLAEQRRTLGARAKVLGDLRAEAAAEGRFQVGIEQRLTRGAAHGCLLFARTGAPRRRPPRARASFW